VVTPLGAFDRSCSPRAEELGTGWKGLAAVRPASLCLAGDGPISGRVLASRFLGGRWQLEVTSPGPAGARVRMEADHCPSTGTEVRMRLRGDLALAERE
jgi:hypothetical protein